MVRVASVYTVVPATATPAAASVRLVVPVAADRDSTALTLEPTGTLVAPASGDAVVSVSGEVSVVENTTST